MPLLNEAQIINMANKLPVVSASAIQILSLIDNPRTSRNQIVEILKSDESLFAECFKQANSAAVSSMREY